MTIYFNTLSKEKEIFQVLRNIYEINIKITHCKLTNFITDLALLLSTRFCLSEH